MTVLPNLEWYLNISTQQQLSPRCPYASVYRCPRFYQSLALLGEAGSTKIATNEADKLRQAWEKTDIWPITDEQATSISGPRDEVKHFSHFCPEVSFDRFDLFADELHKYADEIDVSVAHKELSDKKAPPDDWRWSWALINPVHYTECPLYSLLKSGKGKNGPTPAFPDIGLPDSITTHQISVTEGDDLTSEDIEDLIKYMYDHPEIKSFEVYYRNENPNINKAINDFRISSDTVEMHYYKQPNHDLSFVKAHKNSAESEWEKHLISTSPMYYKRMIALTDRERAKMDRNQNQTIWDKILRHPVVVILTILGSIASIIGLWSFFRAAGVQDFQGVNRNPPQPKIDATLTDQTGTVMHEGIGKPEPPSNPSLTKKAEMPSTLSRLPLRPATKTGNSTKDNGVSISSRGQSGGITAQNVVINMQETLIPRSITIEQTKDIEKFLDSAPKGAFIIKANISVPDALSYASQIAEPFRNAGWKVRIDNALISGSNISGVWITIRNPESVPKSCLVLKNALEAAGISTRAQYDPEGPEPGEVWLSVGSK